MSNKPEFRARNAELWMASLLWPKYNGTIKQVLVGERQESSGEWVPFRSSIIDNREGARVETRNTVYVVENWV